MADMIESLSKLKRDRFILLTVLVACVLCPGFAFLFVFLPEIFAALDFTKLLMLALAITTPVYLLCFLPAIFWVRLGTGGVSAEALMNQVPRDTPNYAEVIREHKVDGRRREREQMELAMLLAALLSIVPLYLPLVIRLFTEFEAKSAIVTVAISAVVMTVAAIIVAAWALRRPRRPLGGPAPSWINGV